MYAERGPIRRQSGRALIAWAAVLLAALPMAAAEAEENRLETAVKATYLVKFAGFVEWPASTVPSPSTPLNICVVGSPLGGLPDQAAAGQAVEQHPLAVRHIAAAEPNAGCHILFTAGAARQSVEAALDTMRHEPVLTVTELPAGAPAKGIINFVLRDGHVRFEIDERQAEQAGLRISSQLLTLAVNIGPR